MATGRSTTLETGGLDPPGSEWSIFFIKNWIIVLCISRDLIGLAAMVYEPLYHAQEIATIELCSGCFCKAKSARYSTTSYCF